MTIICPLCDKPVVFDGGPQHPLDFYCETYVDVYQGMRWCHYWRVTAPIGYQVTAAIPPFIVTWLSKDGHLSVKQLQSYTSSLKPIYQVGGIKLEDLPNIYNRLKNLAVFS